MLSNSDAKLIVEEIREILNLESDDPVSLIETIRKLEKVVKAVPRMESFITSITRHLSDDQHNHTPLEQVIPRVSYLKSLEEKQHSIITQLSSMTNNLQSPDHMISVVKEQLNQQARVLQYLMQLFNANDFKTLLESVKAKMLYYSDASTFMKQARLALNMQEDSFPTIMSVISWYCK